MRTVWRRVLVCVCVTSAPSAAAGQARGQLWATGTIDWLASDRLTYELEAEPKTNPASLTLTPHVDYAIVPWADLLAEVVLERKADANDSATPRFGAQFHILSRLLRAHARPGAEREKLPRRRLAVSSLLRAENANSSWRLRDRLDAAYPLNRHKTSDDGAVYVTSDVELFVPLERAAGAAAVSQMRVRSGVGYRDNFNWRFEALYVWNGTRHADTSPLRTQSHAIDLRVRREF